MPKVAYSEEEREQIRSALVNTGLKLMAKQGFQHTTVEQIYKAVGISRTFFYSFFPTKEDLIVEALYVQQPKILAYARSLMEDPTLSWREGVRQFIHACCYGERNGIAVLTVEEQQLHFPPPVGGKLSGLPGKAGTPVWSHSGVLWDRGEPGADSALYQSESGGYGDPPGHSPDPAAACARGSRRHRGDSDQHHCGLAGKDKGTARQVEIVSAKSARTVWFGPLFRRILIWQK